MGKRTHLAAVAVRARRITCSAWLLDMVVRASERELDVRKWSRTDAMRHDICIMGEQFFRVRDAGDSACWYQWDDRSPDGGK
jgi:hypothetical protein